MRFLKSDRRLIGVLLVLAITQLIGWGTIGLPAVIGRDLAADLGLSLPAVFAGSSVLYVTMGLCAPWLARGAVRAVAREGVGAAWRPQGDDGGYGRCRARLHLIVLRAGADPLFCGLG